MKGYDWYKISADGGETWTTQYITEDEAERERKEGYIVERERRPSLDELSRFQGRL